MMFFRCILSVSLLMAFGCGPEDIPAEPAKPKATETAVAKPTTPAGEEAATVPEKDTPEWSYSPIGKRDPFRSYLADLATIQQQESGPKSETEMFELDQFRLTGLITGTAQPKAMVEDPKGKGHVLHIGSPLGKNGGRITRIDADGIIVTEEMRTPTGERARVPIRIKLPKPELDLRRGQQRGGSDNG